MPLSERYYRADAAFAGFVEGPNDLIDGLSQAILRPVFPLYLGRRSCPPTMPLRLAVRDEEMWEVITTTPWLASMYYQKKQRFEQSVSLRVLADEGVIPEAVGATSAQTLQDVPVSFDSEHRMYTFRTVEETLWKTQSTFQIPRRRTHVSVTIQWGFSNVSDANLFESTASRNVASCKEPAGSACSHYELLSAGSP